MTITVTLTGLDLTEIRWFKESRWQKDVMYTYHSIPGATHGRYYQQGNDSAHATLYGRCLKTTANHNLLESMESSTTYCMVVSTISGTHNAYITGISESGNNSAWYYFTVSLMEAV